MTRAQRIYKSWVEDGRFSSSVCSELIAIADDPQEIEDRFYQDLQFGTAGLRGILGAGTNRMNYYTVARAATAYAQLIASWGEEACQAGIAISYDSRNFSREFAELTARIFINEGVKVFFSTELRPVPVISFAIRHYGCVGGVMITASHNPAIYNGFKVYGEDGAQLPPEEADAIAERMADLSDLPGLIDGLPEFSELSGAELFTWMGEDIDQTYSDYLMTLSLNQEAVAKMKQMPIVYTPLHGSGNKPVRRQLARLGFTNINIVPEQEEPDGDFPTVRLPNPELPEAMQMAIDLAEKIDADLVLATDPDADRTGVVVRLQDGSYRIISGNEIGILLMDYILGSKQKAGKLAKQSFCVTTIVSTRLTHVIAAHYGVALYETFTGFKHIAEAIKEFGDDAGGQFQFGFEESFGYLAGDRVRDKDAVVACMLLAEMAAVAALEGKTLNDLLTEIYKRYGYQGEETVSIYREGKTGQEKISAAMESLRRNRADGIPGAEVTAVLDYLSGERLDLVTGERTDTALKGSNVILYELAGPSGNDWMCVRPSGTEPKIKIYYGLYDQDQASCDRRLEEIKEKTLAHLDNLLI